MKTLGAVHCLLALSGAELPAQRPLCKSKRGVWVKSYARRKVACFAPEFGSKNPPRKVRFSGAHKILSGGPLLRCAFPENCSSQRTQPWRFSKPRSPPWMSGQNLGVSMQKKSYKNWGRLGVCSTKWAPARQKTFLWNTRKFSGAFPHEQPAPKNRISKQAAQLTPGCSVGSWRGCVLHVVTQTCHSSATQQPPHLPLAGGEFPVTLK